jgi:hypothetical protein
MKIIIKQIVAVMIVTTQLASCSTVMTDLALENRNEETRTVGIAAGVLADLAITNWWWNVWFK